MGSVGFARLLSVASRIATNDCLQGGLRIWLPHDIQPLSDYQNYCHYVTLVNQHLLVFH